MQTCIILCMLNSEQATGNLLQVDGASQKQ